MGWGLQNDDNHEQPTYLLKMLATKTMQCPSVFQGEWESHIPGFICIGASTSIGGPCDGDEGGKPHRVPTFCMVVGVISILPYDHAEVTCIL